MTDGTPGWFKDPSDPALARWHDGSDWTEHTLVIADQTPGVEPTPPEIAPAEPTHVARHGSVTTTTTEESRLKALPWWMKIGAPVVAVALAVLAFTLVSSGDDSDDKTDTVDTVAAALDDAVDAARRSGLPTSITDSQAGRLIERICDAAQRPSLIPSLGRDLGRLPVLSVGELRSSVDALGDGARVMCAEDLRDAPDLIDDLQSAAVAAFTTTTTSPTIVTEGVDGGTDQGLDGGVVDPDSPTTTRRTTSTTRRAGTVTTRPGPTTTTAPPLPQVLPGQGCSSAGATARHKITGATLTCKKPCFGSSSKLTWQGACPTTTTIQTPPTQPTTPTTAPPPTSPPTTLD
jgi:hypothetical protein